MKKIYISALAALTVSAAGMSASAAPYIVTGIDSENVVSVSVTAKTAENSEYMIYILKPGYASTDYEDLDTGEWQGIHKIEKLTVSNAVNDDYDVYEYSFDAGEDPDGEYTVIAAGVGFDDMAGRMQTYAKSSTADGYTELNGASKSNIASELLQYNGKSWSVDFNNEVYLLYPQGVMDKLASVCKNLKNDKDVELAFLQSCALEKAERGAISGIYDTLFEYQYVLGIDYCEEIEQKDPDYLKSLNYIRENDKITANNISELETLFRSAEALKSVNEATRDSIISVIKEYNDIFGLDTDTLMQGIDEYSLAKEMINQNGDYTSLQSIRTKFKSAAEKLKNENKSAFVGGGGGSTGGSSGSSGTSSVSRPSITQTEIDNLSPQENSNSFSDINEAAWAQAYIDYLNFNNIMTGDGSGLFRPLDNATREEFVKILVSALKIQSENETEINFEDVPEDAWYYDYIRIAYEKGIVTGIDDVNFGTGSFVTRQDAAVLIERARNVLKYGFKNVNDTVDFVDNEDISDYAKDAVRSLQKADILNGYDDGSFKPLNSITRAEVAKLIYCTLKSFDLL